MDRRSKTITIADISTLLDLLRIDTESYGNLTDDLPVYIWVHDENHTVVYGNKHFLQSYDHCLKKSCYQCLMGEKTPCRCCQSRKSFATNKPQRCQLCKRNGFGYDLNTFHTPLTNKHGDSFILKSSLHLDDTGALAEKNFARKLREYSANIFLVMCSACNKIKDKENNWISIDNYILDNFNVRISHGICPECTDLLYPGLDIPNKDDDQTA